MRGLESVARWACLLCLFACGDEEGPQRSEDAGPITRDGGAPGGSLPGERDASTLPTGEAGPLVDAGPPAERPARLVRYLDGDPADAAVTPGGPGLLLMGGGRDVDDAFRWFHARVGGGDVVVLRASGADGYQRYLYERIGGVDSVETLLVTDRALAADPWVVSRVRVAEGIFLAGGDQADYVERWGETPLAAALDEAWDRGALLGGTSAGLAVMGEVAFSALRGGIRSETALADPHDRAVTLSRGFVTLPPLAGAITDSHFSTRDRLGRLAVFLARTAKEGWATRPIGIGVDEGTALVVDADGVGRVFGRDAVHLLRAPGPAEVCEPRRPLTFEGLTLQRLFEGETLTLPEGRAGPPSQGVEIREGRLTVE